MGIDWINQHLIVYLFTSFSVCTKLLCPFGIKNSKCKKVNTCVNLELWAHRKKYCIIFPIWYLFTDYSWSWWLWSPGPPARLCGRVQNVAWSEYSTRTTDSWDSQDTCVSTTHLKVIKICDQRQKWEAEDSLIHGDVVSLIHGDVVSLIHGDVEH